MTMHPTARQRGGVVIRDRPRTLTKADLIVNLFEKAGVSSKKDAADAVEAVFDAIKETLEVGTRVKVSGFGNFDVRDKSERVGRDLRTGAPITIAARRVITFRPSTILKGTLNR